MIENDFIEEGTSRKRVDLIAGNRVNEKVSSVVLFLKLGDKTTHLHI